MINLRPLLHKLDGLHFHAFRQRIGFGDAFLRRKVAHVLTDLRRTKYAPVDIRTFVLYDATIFSPADIANRRLIFPIPIMEP